MHLSGGNGVGYGEGGSTGRVCRSHLARRSRALSSLPSFLDRLASRMPRFTDLDRAVAHLDGDGACNVEVMLSVDTRSPSDIPWFRALAPFRVAWASGHRARVFVDLVGNVPACFERRSFWWHKVFIAQRLLRCRRLKFLLWLDTDSTIVPERDEKGTQTGSGRNYRARSDSLVFPSLQELWDRAVVLLLADGGELLACRRRRGGVVVPASGGVVVPASGGVASGGGVARAAWPSLASGGGPCFIGYREKCSGYGFNAGVWLVAGGDGPTVSCI